MGNVVSAGVGQAPARQAALKGGLADHVARADHQQGVRLGPEGGDARAPGHPDRRHRDRGRRRHGVDEQRARTCCRASREGLRMGHGEVVDSMIHDGLWCAFENWHMGNAGETRRRRLQGVARGSRTPMPPRATQGGGRARRAASSRDEMLPVSIPQKKGDPLMFDRDESVRADTTAGDAARAEAGVQEGRHGDRRQRAAGQRRRRGAGRDVGRARASSSASRRWRASSRRRPAAWRRRCC